MGGSGGIPLIDCLARDSDDSKKIRQAESIAHSKKNKRDNFQNKTNHFNRFRSNNFSPKTPNHTFTQQPSTQSRKQTYFAPQVRPAFKPRRYTNMETPKIPNLNGPRKFLERTYALDVANKDIGETAAQNEILLSKNQEAAKVK